MNTKKVTIWIILVLNLSGMVCGQNTDKFDMEQLTQTLAKYNDVGRFVDGLCAVLTESGGGFIDKSGKEVIPCIYDDVSIFSEGLARVEKDGKWGFIDKTGKTVIPFDYDWTGHFSEGLAAVTVDNEMGFIDKTGKLVIPPIFDSYCSFSFQGGMAAVRNDEGKIGYINKTGEYIIPPTVYCAEGGEGQVYAPQFSEGMLAFDFRTEDDFMNKGEGYKKPPFGFYDNKGKIAIPRQYEEVKDFSEGLACVQKCDDETGCFWGYIDKLGKEAIPFIFDKGEKFSGGIAKVIKGGKSVFIDKTGKEIAPCMYQFVGKYSEGLILVTNDEDKCGFINASGKEVIPCIYDNAYNFSDGLAKVKKDGVWGFLDKQGRFYAIQKNR
jgi:hypothetical protein